MSARQRQQQARTLGAGSVFAERTSASTTSGRLLPSRASASADTSRIDGSRSSVRLPMRRMTGSGEYTATWSPEPGSGRRDDGVGTGWAGVLGRNQPNQRREAGTGGRVY